MKIKLRDVTSEPGTIFNIGDRYGNTPFYHSADKLVDWPDDYLSDTGRLLYQNWGVWFWLPDGEDEAQLALIYTHDAEFWTALANHIIAKSRKDAVTLEWAGDELAILPGKDSEHRRGVQPQGLTSLEVDVNDAREAVRHWLVNHFEVDGDVEQLWHILWTTGYTR